MALSKEKFVISNSNPVKVSFKLENTDIDVVYNCVDLVAVLPFGEEVTVLTIDGQGICRSSDISPAFGFKLDKEGRIALDE